MQQRKRIVLRETVARDEAGTAAANLYMGMANLIPRGENNPFEKIYMTADDKTSLHYIEDFYLGVNYLLIKGEQVEPIATKMSRQLETYSDEDIRQIVQNARSSEEFIRAISYAGIAAPPQFDATYYHLFETVAAQPDPEVRLAVVRAIAYVGWPEFVPLLQRLKSSDPDTSVRRDADILLQGMAELQTR